MRAATRAHHASPIAVWSHGHAHHHDQLRFQRLRLCAEPLGEFHRRLALMDGRRANNHDDAVVVATGGLRQRSAGRAHRVVHLGIRWRVFDQACRGHERTDGLRNVVGTVMLVAVGLRYKRSTP